jgi:hypothetical protein
MEYFAGMFDAEGWVTLCHDGKFQVAIEMTNEEMINLFQSTFKGQIYVRKRDNRKKTFSWRQDPGTECIINFIDQIAPYTKVKTNQLLQLRTYLNQSRADRRINRSDFVKAISILKKPHPYEKEQIKVPTIITPDESFFKWFAGFIDGDGNFTVFEYQNGPIRTFDSWIGAFNIHAEPIIYIKERIMGSVSQYKGCKFPIWKWVCNQANSKFVCESLEPHLIIKKEQCNLVSQYLNIHAKKIKGVPYSDHTVTIIRDIIKQIKHHNSL